MFETRRRGQIRALAASLVEGSSMKVQKDTTGLAEAVAIAGITGRLRKVIDDEGTDKLVLTKAFLFERCDEIDSVDRILVDENQYLRSEIERVKAERDDALSIADELRSKYESLAVEGNDSLWPLDYDGIPIKPSERLVAPHGKRVTCNRLVVVANADDGYSMYVETVGGASYKPCQLKHGEPSVEDLLVRLIDDYVNTNKSERELVERYAQMLRLAGDGE